LARRSQTPEEKAISAEKRRVPRTWKLRRPRAAGAPGASRSREKESPSRDGAGQPRKGVGSRQRGCFGATRGVGTASPGTRGCGPLSRDPDACGQRERVQTLGPGWVENPRRGRRKLQRGRSPGEYRPAGEGRPDPAANGLAGGSEASKQVKLVERGGSAARDPGRPGSALRRAERGPIGSGGTRQLRESVDVGETAAERSRVVRPGTSVDNCKGARLPREG
jgi:hypothetical protein